MNFDFVSGEFLAEAVDGLLSFFAEKYNPIKSTNASILYTAAIAKIKSQTRILN